MIETLVFVLLAIALLQTAVLAVLFFRKHHGPDLDGPFHLLGSHNERMEKGLSDELLRLRDEQARNSRELREEVGNSLKAQSDSSVKQVEVLGSLLKNQLNQFSETQTKLTTTIETKLNHIQENNSKKLDEMRQT